jgi:hypothetical protein
MGKVEAFEYFGVTLKNTRWSWSGVSTGTANTPASRKVFTAWGAPEEYYKDTTSGKYVYRARWGPEWQTKAGGAEMQPLLEQARLTGEKVRLVYIEAASWDERPLRVVYAKPLDKMWFRATRFDPATGEFDIDQI